jgi:phage tail-like protein
VSTGVPASTSRSDTEEAPSVASAREYLRGGLPAIYRRDSDGFAMRMLESLERVLDPQIAILECLAAYFSPQLAPPGMVEAMSSWLGLPAAESYGQQTGRDLLEVAERLARLRGTRAGLQLALEKCFPKLRLEVEDHGAVLIEGTADTLGPYPGFTVRVRGTLSPIQREQVRRAIEWQRPLQAPYALLDDNDVRGTAR